jgi:ubiquitin carboxyl-terminal hydrolase 8
MPARYPATYIQAATAAAQAESPSKIPSDTKNLVEAESFPLRAIGLLLADLVEGDTVYLLDHKYMMNWLIWCLHQNVKKHKGDEDKRLEACSRRAAQHLRITPCPEKGMKYNDPGCIDSSSLSVEGHPLLLDERLRVHQEAAETISNGKTLSKQHRQMQLTMETSHSNTESTNLLVKYCVAVPEAFYELLRSVHGVLCDDLRTVSFQPTEESQSILLHHHLICPQPLESSKNDAPAINGTTADAIPHRQAQPIEFRRKVVCQTIEESASLRDPPPVVSLMEKLMLEEQTVAQNPKLVVEVHPIKLVYSVTCTAANKAEQNGTSQAVENGSHIVDHQKRAAVGFVLVSRDAAAVAAITTLQSLVAPRITSQSIRTWSKYDYSADPSWAQSSSDGYELVDIDSLSVQIPSTKLPQAKFPTNGGRAPSDARKHLASSAVSVGDWVNQHFAKSSVKELELLVEIRQSVNFPWPRAALELANRIKPGDLVDAQDVAGKWYEAFVRHVEDEAVLVHYAGWASKWDSKVRRRRPSPHHSQDNSTTNGGTPSTPAGVPSKVKAPAPLWSHSGRWRERLRPGDLVEVRDSGSIVERPKWYRGVVKQIGRPNDIPRPLTGGANLEEYSMKEGDERKPFLILGRTQQILVEVEQERSDKASMSRTSPNSSPTATTDSLTAHPPFLRWVNLFGEEICRSGTHLKEPKDEGPVTLQYEFDSNRKPVSVMKSHPTLGSGFMRESLRGTPPAPGSVGLHNLGNSCFLNSTVQCLNHIDPLTQYFVNEKYSKDLNERNPLGSGGTVAIAYASLLKKMWAGQHSILVPRLLKQTVASFAPQFDNSYQHDSHEFCQFLMDGLHEDLNRVKKKPYVEELDGWGMEDQRAAIESWRKHLLRHDSIIVDHCQGMHRSHLTCPQCGRESIKFDVYSSISLPLPTDKVKTTIKLEDCIEKFMEAEQLDERDAYYCPNCRRHVCALKLIALWTVPDILILHLKRFTFDTCMLSGGMLRSKVDSTVEFPINGLDLTKQVLGPIDLNAPPIYNLFGVSEHSGPTANSGHYTATVRNSVDGQWYRCNDSHVGLTSGEAAITGGAYMLFYKRAKGLAKWGGLYKVMKELGIDPYGGMDPIDEEGFRQVKLKKKKKG